MPIFDRLCESCGWSRMDCFEPSKHELACPECGQSTARVWLSRGAAIQTDERFIGGLTLENLGHEPVTVHSRSELKREMEARGLQEAVRHVCAPGSDKSKHTSRWV